MKQFTFVRGLLSQPARRHRSEGEQLGLRLNIWRSEEGEPCWLSLLIDAMEQAARPEVRALPCNGAILKALRAQLAQPVSHYHPYAVSPHSSRN